jgi:hypothetical protein
LITHICETCGVQYAPSAEPPAHCVICEDFRQYVRRDGQSWTHLDALRADRRFDVRELEPGLHGIGIDPPLGIGQRALLVLTPAGNLLWDCTPLLEPAAVQALGGVAAIAISHPHFYSTVADWSAQFGAPVWLPRADAEFRMRTDFEIVDWEGMAEPLPGLRLVQAGGHFPGNAVLEWAAGAGGRGALFTGDTVSVAGDPRWVSFMRSYPNLIPLGPGALRRLTEALAPLEYDRLYSSWWDKVVETGAKAVVARSAARYLEAITNG